MKSLAGFLCFLLLGSSLVQAAESAYTALRALGSARGPEMLKKVVEVRGTHGQDQPEVWRILVEDSTARAGIREFELQSGRVIGERTPTSGYAGAVEGSAMDFGRLNLDSAGAFSVAEKEAQKVQVGFDSVDYILSAAEDRRPVWTLILLEGNRRAVGKIQVSAEDGRILQREGFRPGADIASDQHQDEHEVVVKEHGGGLVGKFQRFGRRMENHFRRDGEKLQEFFVGKSED